MEKSRRNGPTLIFQRYLCYPGKHPDGDGDRRPSSEQLELCYPHLSSVLSHGLIDHPCRKAGHRRFLRTLKNGRRNRYPYGTHRRAGYPPGRDHLFAIGLERQAAQCDSQHEHRSVALQFALVAAVILPLLPDRTIDPFGLLNPFQIWLMVVFISGIGLTGYVLMKILGPSQGITLMGILGGLASSTATTISFSSASRENPQMVPHYAQAVIMASTVMLPRVLFLVLVIHPPLVLRVVIPLSTMLIVGLLFIFVFNKGTLVDRSSPPPSFKIGNPFKLSTAIKFGLLFAFVLIFVEFAQDFLGSTGVYLTSFLTGLTDVDAITLSVTRLTANEKLVDDADLSQKRRLSGFPNHIFTDTELFYSFSMADDMHFGRCRGHTLFEDFLPQQGIDEGALSGIKFPHHHQEEEVIQLLDGFLKRPLILFFDPVIRQGQLQFV